MTNTNQLIDEEDFTPLTMEEELENLAEGIDIGGYYCCDGRECGCNRESKISVLKHFVKQYISQTEQECDKKWRTAIETHKAVQLERFETIPDKNNLIDKDVARGFLTQALETLLIN